MAIFENEEYRSRINRTKSHMDEAGMDILLVMNLDSMNYRTGYDARSFYVPQAAIVAGDDPEPIWIGRGTDPINAEFTTNLSIDRIIGYPDYYVQCSERYPMNYVADIIRQRGWKKKRIDLEMDSYYFSARSYETLRSDLPQATFVDDNLLVNWVRIIKSDQEIKFMQQAGKIMERIMQTAIDTITSGVRGCDAAAAVFQAQISGTSQKDIYSTFDLDR